jgi:hypothetical protein
MQLKNVKGRDAALSRPELSGAGNRTRTWHALRHWVRTWFCGADDRNRTCKPLRAMAPKAIASASSATSAPIVHLLCTFSKNLGRVRNVRIIRGVVVIEHLPGQCPVIRIATAVGTPFCLMRRTALRRKSWNSRPGSLAALVAFVHALRKSRIGSPLGHVNR